MSMKSMSLTLLALTFLAIPAALTSTPAIAQEPMAAEPEISFKATELTTGLYMLEGVGGFTGGNLGLSIGDDGVFLIDDGLPPLTDELLEAVAELTDSPIEFLINTHVRRSHRRQRGAGPEGRHHRGA